MKALGLGFIALGIMALVMGSVPFGHAQTITQQAPGPEASTESVPVPISPIVGGLTVVSGLLLLLVPGRRAVS